jgi:hypothetical protein
LSKGRGAKGLYQYKTIVTDYEGMQEALSVYGAQGWKLASVTPDTWRIVSGKLGEVDTLPLASHAGSTESELSASYYLLVLERQGDVTATVAQESAAEVLDYSDFTLPDY